MKLDGYRSSENVLDRGRGSGGRLAAGGGVGTLLLALVAMYFGVDPRVVLGGGDQPAQSRSAESRPVDEGRRQFVSKVLATTEDAWSELKPGYKPPHLVLFQDQVESACGRAGASVGPFYCGEDQNVYIDLSFYDQLRDRLGAPGDFAQAYVIAHEVGHHVQNLQGTLARVHSQMSHLGAVEKNELSVRLELQADFYAGVWGHYAQKRNLLEVGDVEEALNAAAAIGDDKLQKQGQGYVVPDSFTHGSSEQRIRWFKKGLESGDPGQGDTFNAVQL